MQHILRSGNAPEGFLKTVAGSAALHVVLLLAGLLLYKAEPKRVFFSSPVYTVSLVAGDAAPSLSQPLKEPGPEVKSEEAAKAGEAAKPEAPVKKKETLKATLPVKGRAVKAKGISRKGAKNDPVVEMALKRVSERVKRREESGLVEERIEAIRKKTEGDRTGQGIEEIKKGLSAKAAGTGDALGHGNALSGVPAASAGGVRAGNLEVRYPSYFSMIRDKVQEEWKYPEEFKKDNISVIVSVRIGKTGKLLQAWVEKSSGNSAFDESLVIAVNKAAPYPPLPADFEESYLETGLRFCPRCE